MLYEVITFLLASVLQRLARQIELTVRLLARHRVDDLRERTEERNQIRQHLLV